MGVNPLSVDWDADAKIIGEGANWLAYILGPSPVCDGPLQTGAAGGGHTLGLHPRRPRHPRQGGQRGEDIYCTVLYTPYCTGEAGVPRDQHHRACALRHLAP